MVLIVPFAAPLSDAGRQALQSLRLPQLEALLGRMTPTQRDAGDALSLSPPHERALAQALGLSGADGLIPWAACAAVRDGVDTADLAWGLVTPVHWEVATDHIRLTDPAALDLAEADARALFEAVHPLFESDGFVLLWGAAERWYVAHEALSALPTASLDRVIGRPLDGWLPDGPEGRFVRRLQNEVQMLLYTHPVNEAREAGGALPVNSFWLSGCGLPQRVAPTEVRVDDRLRDPALAGDWAAWAEAWAALDARLGAEPPRVLVLCGERSAQHYEVLPRSLWSRLQSRLRGVDVGALLADL